MAAIRLSINSGFSGMKQSLRKTAGVDAQFSDAAGDIGGQRGGEAYAFAGCGMGKRKSGSVQGLARETKTVRFGMIIAISGKRQTERGGVDANLMRPSGMGNRFKNCPSRPAQDNAKIGPGWFSSDGDRNNGSQSLAFGMVAYGAVACEGVEFGIAVDDGQIFLMRFGVGELLDKMGVYVAFECEDKGSGGVFVEPVGGPDGGVRVGQKMPVAMPQAVLQSIFIKMSAGGMDDDSRGFVDDDKRIVLEQKVDFHGGGRHVARPVVGKKNFDVVGSVGEIDQLLRGSDNSVELDMISFYKIFRPRLNNADACGEISGKELFSGTLLDGEDGA